MKLMLGLLFAFGCSLAFAGETTTARKTPRAWAGFSLPKPGHRKNVSLNTMKDVWQGIRIMGRGRFSNMIDNWSGGAFSADHSQYGAMILKGGGHGSYQASDMYVFDLTTRRFKRILDSWPKGIRGNKRKGVAALYGSCGPYASPDGKKMYSNVLQAYHTYDFVQVIPASAGGGSKGTVVYTASSTGPIGKAVDLANPGSGKWVYATKDKPVRPTAPPGYFYWAKNPKPRKGKGQPMGTGEFIGCSAWDSRRKLIWVAMGPGGMYQLSAKTRLWSGKICENTNQLRGGLCTMQYSPEHDILVLVGKHSRYKYQNWHWLDCRTPKSGWKTIKGKFPKGEIMDAVGSGALQWYPPRKRFIYYKGMGSTRVLHIIPPPGSEANRALLKSGTWTTRVEEIASTKPGAPPKGDAPVVSETAPRNGCYQRFAYVPALKCFLWVDSVTKPAQLWRLAEEK
jgi:hypothetical protein